MYYIYSKYLKTGREDFIKMCENTDDAIRHIHKCYSLDSGLGQLGEYYYFMVKR